MITRFVVYSFWLNLLNVWLFNRLHLLLSPFFAFSKPLWERLSWPMGISQDEIPSGSFQMLLSFPLTNFPFDLSNRRFPSLDLPHLSWRALAGWFGFSLLSILTMSFPPEMCWESAKSFCTWALPCCQRILLKVISSCRQLALLWKGVMLHSCNLLYLAVTQQITFIWTGTFF